MRPLPCAVSPTPPSRRASGRGGSIAALTDAAKRPHGDIYATEHGGVSSQRAYAWDQPAAWIDDVQLFGARNDSRAAMSAGPSGPARSRSWPGTTCGSGHHVD